MGGTYLLRRLAVAAALALPAFALPQNGGGGEVAEPAPSAWVSIDQAGVVGVAVTPSVTTSNGAKVTLNPPPPSLIATGTYTLQPNGQRTTSTGLAPVQTAAGPGSAGAVLACTDYQGVDKPFCAPRRGSILYPGQTYYVTWNPAHFGNLNDAQVELEAVWGDQRTIVTGTRVPGSQGVFAWHLADDILTSRDVGSLNLTLRLQEFDLGTPEDDFTLITGPNVLVVSGTPPNPNLGLGGGGGGGRTGGPSAVVIAVPVVVGLVVLALVGFCVWSWRRTGTWPLVGALGGKGNRRSGGYGERQSRSERVGGAAVGGLGTDKAAPNVGIQLTDRDSWSPTGTGNSRNVFREEVQRQQRTG